MNPETNPYQPPQSKVFNTRNYSNLELAGRGHRLGTWVIDYICITGFSAVFGALAVVLFGDAGLEFIESVPDLVLGVVFLFGYYVFFEGCFARTPGKFVLGTMVIDENSQKPGFFRVMGRTLCRLIPFEAFSFLAAGAVGWHDSISKTNVVVCRR